MNTLDYLIFLNIMYKKYYLYRAIHKKSTIHYVIINDTIDNLFYNIIMHINIIIVFFN